MATGNITGIILAGGRARRMGGQDKGLIKLARKPMIEYVLNAIKPQVDDIIINANRNQTVYEKYGFPVVADQIEGYCGPLEWAVHISASSSCNVEYSFCTRSPGINGESQGTVTTNGVFAACKPLAMPANGPQ